MEKRVVLFFAFAFLFSMTFVSGEILFSQPAQTYNLGESFSINLNLRPSSNTQDFLNADIVCGSSQVNIYKNFLVLNANEERSVNVGAVLSKNLLGGAVGNCFLRAIYGVDDKNSQNFKISELIEVDLDINSAKFNPGDKMIISGTAVRESGKDVQGYVEIKSPTLGITITNNAGKNFNANFSIPENSASGEHELKVRVYERDSLNNVINEGQYVQIIKINPILKSLEIEVSKESIYPEEEYSINLNAFDQAGAIMSQELTLRIFDPNQKKFIEQVISSGTEKKVTFSLRESPGYWKIEAVSGDVIVRKLFYLEVVKKITGKVEENILTLTNVGNSPYRGPIEIKIGDEVQVKEIDLKVGATKKFKLHAPDGEYSIEIGDSSGRELVGSVALTGKAVSVKDIGIGLRESFTSPLVWLLIVVLLGLIVLYIRTKTRKVENYREEAKTLSSVSVPVIAPKLDLTPKSYGKKEEASIIAMRFENVPPSAGKVIDDALTLAKNSGAKVYVDGHYRIIIFSEMLTKTKENDSLAVKVAKRMEGMFLEQNSRFKEKILFGMGISSGEVIVENNQGNITYTSVGNAISKAKSIAQDIDGEVLISENTHRRVINQIKTEKLANRDVWRIVKIQDRGKHEDFLKRFTKRNK